MGELLCFPSTHFYEDGYIWLNAFADWIGEHLEWLVAWSSRGEVWPQALQVWEAHSHMYWQQ